MKAKKIAIIVGVVILLGAIVGFTVNQSQKNVVTVQTGKVYKQDISSVVTASGQIKPKTIVNVGANAMGRIVRLFVKEGETVKKNQVLAQLENVQSAADVAMTRATSREQPDRCRRCPGRVEHRASAVQEQRCRLGTHQAGL